jgi:hypothetical protein
MQQCLSRILKVIASQGIDYKKLIQHLPEFKISDIKPGSIKERAGETAFEIEGSGLIPLNKLRGFATSGVIQGKFDLELTIKGKSC